MFVTCQPWTTPQRRLANVRSCTPHSYQPSSMEGIPLAVKRYFIQWRSRQGLGMYDEYCRSAAKTFFYGALDNHCWSWLQPFLVCGVWDILDASFVGSRMVKQPSQGLATRYSWTGKKPISSHAQRHQSLCLIRHFYLGKRSSRFSSPNSILPLWWEIKGSPAAKQWIMLQVSKWLSLSTAND